MMHNSVVIGIDPNNRFCYVCVRGLANCRCVTPEIFGLTKTEEAPIEASTGFVKHDSAKPDYSIVDADFLASIDWYCEGENLPHEEKLMVLYADSAWLRMAVQLTLTADYSISFMWGTVEAITAVLTYGARKYSRDNWRLNTDTNRIKSALLRHLRGGDGLDEESGLPHKWHAATNCMFLWCLANKGSK